MSRLHFHSLTVSQVIRECDDAVAVTFDVPEALRATYAYQPGQYLTLRQEIAGEEQHRSYSLCSSPLDGEWRIGIRELPGGVFSTWANRTLRAGMTVDCMPPDGRFCPALDATTAKHFVLIAVGSGITPCLSIAKAVLQSAPRSRVTLLYGNRRAASAMFREALEDLKNRYLDRFALYCVFSREASDVPLFEGRLDGAKVREFLACLVPAATIDEAFLCGPNAMLDAVERVLLVSGWVIWQCRYARKSRCRAQRRSPWSSTASVAKSA
jgi:ring-1,2-phenylacetyl-CoA epoxidase subunit PaaE